ncbi:hypothetical protein ACFFWB_07680 [Flavobacterium procerum]|uniref:hypothetical protein n=1 Tax=Flavobacterium procerum TaxID=1455569 RepID=UPI0035EEED29
MFINDWTHIRIRLRPNTLPISGHFETYIGTVTEIHCLTEIVGTGAVLSCD